MYWRPLVEGFIAYTGFLEEKNIPKLFNNFLVIYKNQVFGSSQTTLLCIVGELAGEGPLLWLFMLVTCDR